MALYKKAKLIRERLDRLHLKKSIQERLIRLKSKIHSILEPSSFHYSFDSTTMGEVPEYKYVELSTADNALAPRHYMGVTLCFQINNEAKVDAQDVLDYALARLLTRMNVLAGTVSLDPAQPSNGRLVLRLRKREPLTIPCRTRHLSSEGFPFTYKELQDKQFPPAAFDKAILSPFPDAPSAEDQSPVFGMQKNFIDGGLLLSFCLHHAVGDGYWLRKIVQFFSFCLLQNFDIEIISAPLRIDEFEASLKLRNPEKLVKKCDERVIVKEGVSIAISKMIMPDLTTCIFQMPLWLIPSLKEYIRKSLVTFAPMGAFASTNDCIAAYAWAHMTKARWPPADPLCPYEAQPANHPKYSKLFIPLDFRNRIQPSFTDKTYIGNAIITVPAVVEVHTLVGAAYAGQDAQGLKCLAEVALAIRQQILKVDDAFIRQRLELGKSMADIRQLKLDFNPTTNTNAVFNNLSGFGEGFQWYIPGVPHHKPQAIRSIQPDHAPGVITALPSADGETMDIQITLTSKEMDLFREDIGWKRMADNVIE
ncbi:MAG: hypothetical protein M1819_004564 [Sarea resinae]|nr:MAG: hypothetical protein M1819_004564 [Sarea resinae]